uniref:Peroxisomal leader peptide-processing protease n=1 Tax=Cacopsylla melanoneura TaxID=428564 RepID=A0A8D8X0H3_9HEMI
MALHIGTLLLNSLGTESPCVIIRQDGQLHCLVSATCLTPYFTNSNPDKVDSIKFNELLYDNSIYGEVTDIRNIQSFKVINPKPNVQKDGNTAYSAVNDASNSAEAIDLNRNHIQTLEHNRQSWKNLAENSEEDGDTTVEDSQLQKPMNSLATKNNCKHKGNNMNNESRNIFDETKYGPVEKSIKQDRVDKQTLNSYLNTDSVTGQIEHLNLEHGPNSSSICLSPHRSNSKENNVDNIKFNEISCSTSIPKGVTDIQSNTKDFNICNPRQSLNNSIRENRTDSFISIDENLNDIQSKKKEFNLKNLCKSTRCNGNNTLNSVEELESIDKSREHNLTNKSVHHQREPQCHENTRVRPCLIYKITEAESTLRKMFLTQDFKINNNTDRAENELFFQLASTVVIFGTSKNNLLPMLSSLLSSISMPSPGIPVLVVSNPFHHECLRYSWSSGIVSSMLGESPVFLTDARLSPGSEGAPVFNLEGGLVGIVICSLYQKQQHAISFSLGLSLNCIFQGVIKPVLQKFQFPSEVVLVRCGIDWGSGVILDAESGLVLTCAHVVSGNNEEDISISYLTETYSATIVFQRSTGSAFDLALLSTNCKLEHAQSVVMSPSIPTTGMVVTCAGYPVFNEHAIWPLSATLSRGILSKLHKNLLPEDYFKMHSSERSWNPNDHQILPHNRLVRSSGNISHYSNLTEHCVMLQTSCTVEAGISGGALFDSAGLLIGVIVCNVTDHNVVYPHVNMAVPICTIYPVLDAYLRTKDPTILGKLNVFNIRTKQTWNFEPMLSKL